MNFSLNYKINDFQIQKLYKYDFYFKISQLKTVDKIFKKGDNFGIYSFFSGKQRETGAISKHVTSVVMLELKDFISIIQEYKEDYEIFCMMKDKINLNNSAFGLDVKCKSCGKFNHQLNDCPLITYRPKKQLVIARSNRSLPQVRSKHDRRQMRSPNSLFIWKYIKSFDSDILKSGYNKTISSMTKLDEFILEKKLSYSFRGNMKYNEDQMNEDQINEDKQEVVEIEEAQSDSPFEEHLYPKQLSNQSKNAYAVQENNLNNSKILSQQGSNLIFQTITPQSIPVSNVPNSITIHNTVTYVQSQDNVLSQNQTNFCVNQPISPSKFRKSAERDEAIKFYQVAQRHSGQNSKNLIDEISLQAKHLSNDNSSNYSLKKKKKQQLKQRPYSNTTHNFNSTLNYQRINSNSSMHNPNSHIIENQQSSKNDFQSQQKYENFQNQNSAQLHNQQNQNNNNNQQQQNSLILMNNTLQQQSHQDYVKRTTLDQFEENKNQLGSEKQVIYNNQLSEQFTKNEQMQGEAFFTIIDFEKGKYFKRYLPHNNFEKVLARFRYIELKRQKSRMTSFIKKGSQSQIQKEKFSLSQVVRKAEQIKKQRKLSLFIQQTGNKTTNISKFKERHSVQSNIPLQNQEMSKLKQFQHHLSSLESKDIKLNVISKSEGYSKQNSKKTEQEFDQSASKVLDQ